jgi:hypothetical protein
METVFVVAADALPADRTIRSPAIKAALRIIYRYLRNSRAGANPRSFHRCAKRNGINCPYLPATLSA